MDDEPRARIEEMNSICEAAMEEAPPEPDPHREAILQLMDEFRRRQ